MWVTTNWESAFWPDAKHALAEAYSVIARMELAGWRVIDCRVRGSLSEPVDARVYLAEVSFGREEPQ
jgi:hypothetical protein